MIPKIELLFPGAGANAERPFQAFPWVWDGRGAELVAQGSSPVDWGELRGSRTTTGTAEVTAWI